MNIVQYNRDAWDGLVERGNEWTVPVSSQQIARARQGDFEIVLTPHKPIPKDWWPPLSGLDLLGLASGGGQQGPILAAAGARVTILDNSPKQLERDREVARREGLALQTIQGDMMNMVELADASFDLIVHPVSNCFVPDVSRVWKEAARVLRPGGQLFAGFCNPVQHLVDPVLDTQGIAQLKYSLPYSDVDSLTDEERRRYTDRNDPLEYAHTLEQQIGGQIDAGFVITGFYEDGWEPSHGAIHKHLPAFMVTRAVRR
jgi:SAM-dependent methyltransferase